MAIGNEMMERSLELGAVLNREEGKPLAEVKTKSLARAKPFRRNARTRVVTVNLPTAGTDYHVPFGGRGDSSYGAREQGRAAAEFYTTVKTVYVSAGNP